MMTAGNQPCGSGGTDTTPAYQGTHDSVFGMLEQQNQWTRTVWTKRFEDGIVEVRLNGKVKWRVLGYYGDVQREFVVVLICNHKGKVYVPKGALRTAAARMNAIKAGREKAVSCVRPS